jgi:hypothetical protein
VRLGLRLGTGLVPAWNPDVILDDIDMEFDENITAILAIDNDCEL